MAFTTVRGYYRNGRIELEELPEGIQEAEVMVTFLAGSDGVSRTQQEQAVERMLQQMQEGFPLGGKGYTSREEIYEERLGRFFRRDD